MPTARAKTSAVCIPSEGVLVVGGEYHEYVNSSWFSTGTRTISPCNLVQLLRGDLEGGSEQKWSWTQLPSMVCKRKYPGIAYFNGSVFVAGGNVGGHFDIEQMRYPVGANTKAQWTIISLMELPPMHPYSLVVHNGRMLLICEFTICARGSILITSSHLNSFIFRWRWQCSGILLANGCICELLALLDQLDIVRWSNLCSVVLDRWPSPLRIYGDRLASWNTWDTLLRFILHSWTPRFVQNIANDRWLKLFSNIF